MAQGHYIVLQGRFVIDLEGQSIILEKYQGFTIPRGIMHKSSASESTVILMMEAASVTPTGDYNKSSSPRALNPAVVLVPPPCDRGSIVA